MKVLVLGSTGLIGHQIFNYLDNKKIYTLHNLANKRNLNKNTINLDVRNKSDLVQLIKKIRPDIIINCIGVLIEESEKNPIDAIFLNAYLPHILSKTADQINAKLIHISTDCVFSGIKKPAYIETDYKDGMSIYAKTKGLGELNDSNHLTIRTSVVGPELKTNGVELFHWFMNQTADIEGYTDAIWSGVTTFELAKAVKWAIDNQISGLYHLTNNEQISKYELLNLFKKYTKKNISIKRVTGKKTDKSFIDTRMLLNYKIPSYDMMVEDMIEFISNNKNLYSQYKIGS
jgi:dTDP-4-dehydrorhamnose reductase